MEKNADSRLRSEFVRNSPPAVGSPLFKEKKMTSILNLRERRFRRFALTPRRPATRRRRTLFDATTLAVFVALAFGLGAASRSEASEPIPRRSLETPARLPDRNLPFAGLATRSATEITAELAGKSPEELVADARALLEEEMNADAFAVWEAILANPNVSETTLLQALALFAESSGSMRDDAWPRFEAALDRVLAARPDSWRVKKAVVELRSILPSYGTVVDGVFVRSNNWRRRARNGRVSGADREARISTRILRDAVELARAEIARTFSNGLENAPSTPETDALRDEVARLYLAYGRMFGALNPDVESRVAGQRLTDLEETPELTEATFGRFGGSRLQGAPVDADGNPLVFALPETFEAAKNDGERARRLETDAFELGTNAFKAFLRREQADVANRFFGVDGLNDYSHYFPVGGRDAIESFGERPTGVWDLHTLDDSETIARLATGVKRFKLPEHENYFLLWREAIEYGDGDEKLRPLRRIALEYQNRRQYDKALATWRQLLETALKTSKAEDRDDYVEQARQAIERIVDPWGRFDFADSKINGAETVVSFICRNADAVEFVVREIDPEKTLKAFRQADNSQRLGLDLARFLQQKSAEDLENGDSYLYFSPEEREREKPDAVGYLGAEIARKTIEPGETPLGFNRRIKFDLPTKRGGIFYVEAVAKNADKEAKKAIAFFWKPDAAILTRSTADGEYYYVADALTGAPLANADVELSIVETIYDGRGKSRTQPSVSQHVKTDENGSFVLAELPGFKPNSDDSRRSFSVVALVPTNVPGEPPRLAYLTTQRIDARLRRAAKLAEQEVKAQTRAYFVSDRPVYRPGQKAEFKFWVGTAKYDLPETHLWAGKEVRYAIFSPRGDELATKTVVLDDFGAFAGSFELPKDSQLGVYSVQIQSTNKRFYYGDGSFRLEEYRKPEFKVDVDAPSEPIALGGKIEATISAKYYFGSPVTEGEVSYKVTRTTHNETWYPERPWDWFYGPGYGWLARDFASYPGWAKWGWSRPAPTWRPRSGGVPEVVLEGKAALDADGKAQIIVDTSFAKEIFPNDDQKYEIVAEVVDRSRRAIVGTGSVFATRVPFRVCVWTDRGFYDAGSQIEASFQTRRLDGKPVVGFANVRLFKIEYPALQTPPTGELRPGAPVESEVFSQRVETNADGRGTVSLVAAAPGQYRLSCEVETPQGLCQEGATILNVGATSTSVQAQADAKKAAGSSAFLFNELDITVEKPEFKVGETARLQIESSRPNATVLLFERSEHDVSPTKPRLVKLENGAACVEFAVEKRDLPNFFVEAATIFDGQIYEASQEIVVPPESRVLNVEVQPAKTTVAPGEKTKIAVRLTDLEGRPIVGQTVVSVYDKALEQLVGRGPNDEDVRKFFWNWRRYGQSPNFETNLRKIFLTPNGSEIESFEIGMYDDALILDGESFTASFATRAAVFDAPTAGETAPMLMKGDMAAGQSRSIPATTAEAAPAETGVFHSNGVAAQNETVDAAAFDAGSTPQLSTQPTFIEATTRKNLADLAFWAADLRPNDDGVVEIEVETPENLTTWKVAAWSVGAGLRVGSGTSEFVSRKDVIVRMQKPRFLTQNDEAVLSALVHNYLDSEKTIQVSLAIESEDADSPRLTFIKNADAAPRTVVVPASGEARVDWLVKARHVGEATLTMKALSDEESDAIQETLPVLERGATKQIAVSGTIPADANAPREAKFRLTVPEARRPETTKLTVRFSPTLAGAIFDALPYMIEYPYGCNEQTLNRFMPLVIAQKALLDSGVDLAALKEKRANLNAQELGDAKERAAQWKHNPFNEAVYDVGEARKLAQTCVDKLVAAQCSDGGWGWFSGVGERSSAEMTALVVRGLVLARANDQAVPEDALQNGVAWLRNHQREEALKILRGKVWSDEQKTRPDAWKRYKNGADEADALVYYALSEAGDRPVPYAETFVNAEDTENVSVSAKPAELFATMKEFLWEARTKLQLYPLSMFAIALDDETKTPTQGRTPELVRSRNVAKSRVETILRRLSQYRRVDDENQTVWLDLDAVSGWLFWRWHGSEFETQAFYLKLLSRVDDETLRRLGLADDAPRLVKYLLNNRKHATYWNSTRDAAVCVEAFVEYLRRTDELATNSKVEVYVDGELRETVEYAPETLFEIDGTFVLDAEQIATGDREIALRVVGSNPLYYNAYLEFFTLEDPIEKAGLEVKVERRYYKLEAQKDATTLVAGGRGQAVDQRIERYKRVPLKSGDAVVSGDLVEVELILESKNEYESILLEDRKAAGFEPVEQTSGYNGNNLGAYVEYRDDRVCFFASRIPRGRTTVAYRLRAETPGRFSALPTRVEAMYAPELRGNSDEFKAGVLDREIGGDAKRSESRE